MQKKNFEDFFFIIVLCVNTCCYLQMLSNNSYFKNECTVSQIQL